MNEPFTIIFDKEQQVTIATCLGCGASITLDYATEHIGDTEVRAVLWGREHAGCATRIRPTGEGMRIKVEGRKETP